ncbi:MAG TPA: plastocyanin/azurin family copper-binding protein [Gemmatimonadales bacterium]|jgi:plastocyanin|nr:plastocyanin/azurin family copper-binding protein [Gemmatimonadales bacterium]
MRPLPLIALGLSLSPAGLGAQSLLYRPPNLAGTWVPDAGVVQFNFVHRFHVLPGPTSVVVNFPTFTLAAGVGHDVDFGLRFGTKSAIPSSGHSTNESEWFARWRVVGGPEGRDGFAVAVTPAYNQLAQSADGEVDVDWTTGRFTLTGAARGMTKPFGGPGARAAFGGGVVARLTPYIGLSADVGSFVAPTTLAVWGVALNVVIPGSPHTFSLQAGNASVNTIEGNSQGAREVRYGFEFTIPLHLKRFAPWFHGSPSPAAGGAPTGVAAEVPMRGYKFQRDPITIAVGQAVRWTNGDPVEHTVTFDSAEPGSAPVPPNGTYVHRFDKAGTYRYHCTPHPFMTGVVVVK